MVRNVDGNETTYMIIKDQLGSILQLVDQNGNVAQDIEYDEFGNMTLNTNPNFQPLGFASGLYDPDTKLTRFGARDYDPVIGRWLQRDPIKFDGGTTNLYDYCKNDPVNCIDPEGTFPKNAEEAYSCLNGFYRNQIQVLLTAITNNEAEIARYRRQQESDSRSCTNNDPRTASGQIAQLTRVNEAFRKTIQEYIEICSGFPEGDP
jgi:RHS repeat-associated protein